MWYLRHHARRIIRNTMRPMEPDVARKWLLRMRVAYVGLGMLALGFSYQAYRQNKDVLDPLKNLDPTDAHRQARLKGEPGKVHIYRYVVGQKPQYFEYENSEYIEDYKRREAVLKAELAEKLEAKKRKSAESGGKLESL